jgi:hypothetical protein
MRLGLDPIPHRQHRPQGEVRKRCRQRAIWDATNLDKKPQISSVVKVKSEPKTRNQNHDVHYANCDAVRAAGKAPIRRGDPGYAPHLDRDNDGIGCES